MSKDVVNMIANLKQMWWRPYLLTFVSKYGLHHVYPLVNIIFDTYLLICKDEQIHFFMQCNFHIIVWYYSGNYTRFASKCMETFWKSTSLYFSKRTHISFGLKTYYSNTMGSRGIFSLFFSRRRRSMFRARTFGPRVYQYVMTHQCILTHQPRIETHVYKDPAMYKDPRVQGSSHV